MSNIDKFNPQSLADTVKDRLKATFISLIPEEQWDQLVSNEIEVFFEKKEDAYSTNRTSSTKFQQLIQKELENYSIERLKEYFASDQFRVAYDEKGEPVMSEAINKLIAENSGQMLMNLFHNAIQQHFHQLSYTIQNPQQRY